MAEQENDKSKDNAHPKRIGHGVRSQPELTPETQPASNQVYERYAGPSSKDHALGHIDSAEKQSWPSVDMSRSSFSNEILRKAEMNLLGGLGRTHGLHTRHLTEQPIGEPPQQLKQNISEKPTNNPLMSSIFKKAELGLRITDDGERKIDLVPPDFIKNIIDKQGPKADKPFTDQIDNPDEPQKGGHSL